MSLLNAGEDDQPHVATRTKESQLSFRDLPTPLQEMCLYVLRTLLTHLRRRDPGRDSSAHESNGWADIAIDRITTSLQVLLNHTLDQEDEMLKDIAEKLCRNTMRPLRDDVPTLKEWLDQFCDTNLRWESLGLLWIYAGRVSDALHAVYIRRVKWLAENCSIEVVQTCFGYCIHLACHFAEHNVLLLDLCRRKATLESIIIGETRRIFDLAYVGKQRG